MSPKYRNQVASRRAASIGRGRGRSAPLAAVLVGLLTVGAWAADARTVLKPGWNMFSPQQDVEVGEQVSPDAERELPMLRNARVDDYVDALGRRLAAEAQGERYPYTFKVVNDPAINAFALPGGPIYINRGVIDAAENEAQLAAVVAHEISHVALRHGTNQASKASAAQLPLAILGGLIGSDSTKAALAQLGAGFAVNSILLKYSRTAESQADILGTQILFDAGYDPRAMAQFLRTIEAEHDGGGGVEFFSNHPSPDNRIDRVNEEVTALGGVRRGSTTNSQDFDRTKRYAESLAGPPADGAASARDDSRPSGTSTPDRPSERYVSVDNTLLRIDHPDNWQSYGRGDAMTITPRGGLIADDQGNQALAYGVIVSLFEPRTNAYGQTLQGRGYGQDSARDAATRLEQSTDQLFEDLRLSNRNIRVTRSPQAIRVDGERALSTYLSNDSPVGGRETDWLVTLEHPDGLLFIVFTAPERDVRRYESAFQAMLRSVRIKR